MKLSVIIPSCFRPKLFEQCIRRIRETTKSYDIEIIAVIDCDEITREIAFKNNCIVNYSPVRRGAIRCWNIGLSHSSGDFLFPNGDDSYCHDNWLDYALESHRDKLNNYGAVGLNDCAYDGNLQLATTLIFDRKFCIEKLGGVIAMPVYNYYRVDTEINARAKRANAFYWDSRAKVEHLHSAHGKRELDQHDKDRVDSNYMELDRLIYEDRERRGFLDDFDPVITK